MLNRDPPEHGRMRRLVNRVFTPRRIEKLEHRIASHAHALVDRVREAGSCDFATAIAGEMPLFVICEILGVPVEDRLMLYALTSRMFGNTLADPDARHDVMAAAGELRSYGAALAADKARAPAEDLLSELVASKASDGKALTGGEVEAFFMLLFNAGADTTRSLLCFGLEMLLERPTALAKLRADLAKLPFAIEEMLRFESPVIQFRRTAMYDSQLGGKTIAEGDRVVVFFPSANRDDAIFERPDELDLARWPNQHLAFGYGTHFCIGAPLARLEALHVFHAVLTTLDDITMCAPPVRSRSNFIRSIHRFEIAFRGRS